MKIESRTITAWPPIQVMVTLQSPEEMDILRNLLVFARSHTTHPVGMHLLDQLIPSFTRL